MMYKVSMSNKESVVINEENYTKLINNVDKNFVLLGNELVNPSFIVSVTKIMAWEESVFRVTEKPKRIKGHIDRERGVYVIDSEEEIEDDLVKLEDKNAQ